MASSNRHWPSLFKSKPSCASAHHQWQHDINHSSLLSNHCQKPNSYASGGEERTPEPKPRWNPKPEQIRILEAIFNSGMVNPPRDEIRRIRAQLQAYGQVGDANVFYWFQNRKSRSKNKQRQLKSSAAAENRSSPSPSAPHSSSAAPPPPHAASSTTSSSSSSRSSSGSDKQILPRASDAPLAALFDNPTPQKANCFHAPFLMPELGLDASLFLPSLPQTYPLPLGDLTPGMPSLLGGLIAQGVHCKSGAREDQQLLELDRSLGHVLDDAPSHPSENPITTSLTSSGPVNELQVIRSIVFINEVAYEVTTGPLNIRQAFGDDAVLLNSSGLPVLTDDWGFTLQPLQHGASYYLVQ
ncbi:hypothetical protein HPP92_023294 [Vanilla planifolia]|uniref:Homeobox domain-containing protein n=1 Tax=Vanilla planifolia TaxID=51239 RepID=A0A835UE02_VANPL|nr:hypothetical protein HPP92_023294 [Vanilla planifolia]